ncbi:MAG: molybdenum cofactor guanylyltransferase [Thermoplasmata archaeon]
MSESLATSALILAGGVSKRFGQPKALIEMAGRPLIVHVAAAIASLANETIISVADPALEERIRSILPRAVFARDVRPGRGPIEGFHRGFRAATGELLLVAPCDAPFLEPQLYRLLLDVLREHDAAVPEFEVFDPVRAVYRRAPVLEVFASSPNIASPSALVDRLECVFVGPDRIRAVDPDLASFLDVNTHADLDEALRRIGSPTEGRGRE